MFVGDRLGRCLASCNARVVDKDIDPAIAGHELICDLTDTARVGDIHSNDFRAQALCFETGATRLGRFGIAIGDDDPCSRLRQGFSASEPDSLTSPGHHGRSLF